MVFRHRFVKKFLCWFSRALLIVFLGFTFIVLCSTFQNGCSSWVFWVIQFEVGLFRFSVSRLVYFSQNFWRKNVDLPFCTVVPPRPRYRFRVIFRLKLVMRRGKWCDVWQFNHTSVGLTWGNVLIVNRHYESYLLSNIFFISVFVILGTVCRFLT